jgi:hypothetical protein
MIAGEDHYILVRPDAVWRTSAGSVARLQHPRIATLWSRPGPGRRATAAVLLRDATGFDAGPPVCAAFTREVLDHYYGERRFAIAVREVAAWRAEREADVEARVQATPVPRTLPEMLAFADAELKDGPWSSWLDVFRAVHGPPDLASSTTTPDGLSQIPR